MNVKNRIAPILMLFVLVGCQLKSGPSNENEELTSKFFDVLKKDKDNARLTQFFTKMPKGGDLHHHYSGAIYAETYLDWAAARQMSINSLTYKIDTTGTLRVPFISIDSLRNNSQLYRAALDAWSDMDYSSNSHVQDQPDQHFFNTFSYFGTVASMDYRAGLLNIKSRAKKENVQYIETMINAPTFMMTCPPNTMDLLLYYQKIKDASQLNGLFNNLAASMASDSVYNTYINAYKKSLYRYRENLDDSDFKLRYQIYATRNSNPDRVFAKLYSCFDAASRDKSSLIVGVNLVGPENGFVALRDYWLHMQMFKFLKKKFPTVKTAMHAGELSMGMVVPEDLTHHISDAVSVAKANRIGHGVDLPYETNSIELLNEMRDNHIAVEINLTSNEFILGIKNEDHPINLYAKAGVPIVISTDDAGVSRNNLTVEFVKLASRYNFDYKQLKQFVYNSIQYSFMDEANKKAVVEKLDDAFVTFESKIASQYNSMVK